MNVNDKGFSQTLYNVFAFIPPENILCITSKSAFKKHPPSSPFTFRYITYKYKLLNFPYNRFTKNLSVCFDWLNYKFNKFFRSFKNIQAEIIKFNPDVIVLAPNGVENIFLYPKLRQAFKTEKVFPYFMDDWMPQHNSTWADKVDDYVKLILSNHGNWLMISESLADILSARYQIIPKRVLEIHNPVELKYEPLIPVYEEKDQYTFVYAGSLWAMHFDALLIICRAINILTKTKNLKLLIYTAENHWEWRKKDLKFEFVEYGGNIPYENIQDKLSLADCLIITASFSEKWYTHTKGSVQTKLTDYMKAARLIISCAPGYAANNKFLKKYCCGICIETTDEVKAAEIIDDIINNMKFQTAYIKNGVQALKENFTFQKVHQKLKHFLSA